VAEYAKMMSEKRWVLNGSAIALDNNGWLIDGQHRLHACISAQVPFDTLVVRGCGERAAETIDTGEIRRPSDLLFMNGSENTVALSAALNLLWFHENGHLNRINNTTLKLRKIDTIDFSGRHEGLAESVVRTNQATVKKLMPLSHAAFLHYVFSKKNPELAEAFFEALDSGENLTKANPIYVLREKLRDLRVKQLGGRPDKKMLVAYTVKAWNAFVMGKKIRVLRLNPQMPIEKIAA
jgi:hypothetical protein